MKISQVWRAKSGTKVGPWSCAYLLTQLNDRDGMQSQPLSTCYRTKDGNSSQVLLKWGLLFKVTDCLEKTKCSTSSLIQGWFSLSLSLSLSLSYPPSLDPSAKPIFFNSFSAYSSLPLSLCLTLVFHNLQLNYLLEWWIK